MSCKTRYIRRANVIKTINGNVYPLVREFLRAVKNTNGLLLFKCNMLHDDVFFAANCTCRKYVHQWCSILWTEKMKNNIVLEIFFWMIHDEFISSVSVRIKKIYVSKKNINILYYKESLLWMYVSRYTNVNKYKILKTKIIGKYYSYH